jgi:Uma2 family endonuclease
MIAITQPQLGLESEQSHQPNLSFEKFLAQYPENGRYELIAGEMVEMVHTRYHKIITMSIMFLLNDEIRRLKVKYDVSNEAVIRTINKKENPQGRVPDVSVIDRETWRSNLTDYGALIEPIQLAVEVVSTNWEDDYIDKLDEYSRLGIPEYWIVDYLAIGSRDYLGDPKEPSVLVFSLDSEGNYQLNRFQNQDPIISTTFPKLKLTVAQIISA